MPATLFKLLLLQHYMISGFSLVSGLRRGRHAEAALKTSFRSSQKLISFTPLHRKHSTAAPHPSRPRSWWKRLVHKGQGRAESTTSSGMRVSARQLDNLRVASGLGHLDKAAFPFGASGPAPPVKVSRLRDLFGTEYVGPIGVGTLAGSPQSELNVIYDTGSADLWIASDLCQSGPCTLQNRNRFNHTLSETFQSLSEPTECSTLYGSGELLGVVGEDTIRLGPVLSHHQKFGLITKESGEAFYNLPMEGIVGLGFPSLAADPSISLLGGLALRDGLALPQFAFYLHREPQRGGGVLWGGVDKRLFHGELTWFPVSEELYWSLELLSFHMGNYSIDFTRSFSLSEALGLKNRNTAIGRAVVDSGTTFFTAEGSVYEAIMHQTFLKPCSELDLLPDMVYTIRAQDGHPRNISVSAYDYMVDRGTPWGACMPGVLKLEISSTQPTMILGETFMRRYFTVFHMGTLPEPSAIGFAPAKYDAVADSFFEEVESY